MSAPSLPQGWTDGQSSAVAVSVMLDGWSEAGAVARRLEQGAQNARQFLSLIV
jgi:hypothetical protein